MGSGECRESFGNHCCRWWWWFSLSYYYIEFLPSAYGYLIPQWRAYAAYLWQNNGKSNFKSNILWMNWYNAYKCSVYAKIFVKVKCIRSYTTKMVEYGNNRSRLRFIPNFANVIERDCSYSIINPEIWTFKTIPIPGLNAYYTRSDTLFRNYHSEIILVFRNKYYAHSCGISYLTL